VEIDITLLNIVGAALAFLLGWMLSDRYGDEIAHRAKYKVWTLPCPACRDEDDKPTGEMQPESPALRRMAMQVTEGGDLPTFECSECHGTKKVHYEFPRSKPPTINERQMITGPIHAKLEKGRWVG
jgi:hypothetical protein